MSFISGIVLASICLAAAMICLGYGYKRKRDRIFGATGSAPELIFFVCTCVLLTLLWNWSFLFSSRIGIFDWTKEIYFFHFIHSSLLELGEYPLTFLLVPSAISRYPTLSMTSSAWANPEVLSFSPMMLLIHFMPVVQFIKTYIFLHYCLACVGMYVLSKRIRLDLASTITLYMLIVLNPWLMQHIAIGYTPWITFCFLPLIIALLAKSQTNTLELGLAACLNALIIYEGGLHIFIWFNSALIVFCLLFSLRRLTVRIFPKIFLFVLMSLLLSLPKLAAILSVFSGWVRQVQKSYSSLSDLWGLMTDSDAPLYELPKSYDIYGVNLYDGSMFMGYWFVGLVAISLFLSVVMSIRKPEGNSSRLEFPIFELLVLAVIFVVLGWDGVWKSMVQICPALSSQVYPWRLSFVSLFSIIACMVWELAKALAPRCRPGMAGMLVALLLAPTILSIYSRNQLFVNVASQQQDPIAAYSVSTFLKQQGVLGSCDTVDPSLNRLLLCPPDGRDIVAPWLEKSRLADLDIENASIHEMPGISGVMLRAIDSSKPIAIFPKDFHMDFFLGLGLSSFLLTVSLTWHFERRRRFSGSWKGSGLHI